MVSSHHLREELPIFSITPKTLMHCPYVSFSIKGSFNLFFCTEMFKILSGKGMSWWYTWAPGPLVSFDYRDTEFVPMIWGEGHLDPGQVARIPPNSKYLLGFNEPMFFDGVSLNKFVLLMFFQANLSPEHAARLWPQLEKIARDKGLKLVSPAVIDCRGGCWTTNAFE